MAVARDGTTVWLVARDDGETRAGHTQKLGHGVGEALSNPVKLALVVLVLEGEDEYHVAGGLRLLRARVDAAERGQDGEKQER
jgi:hypothetical protein